MNQKIFIILAFIAVIFGCASPGIIVQNFEAEQIVHSSLIKTTDNITDYVFFLALMLPDGHHLLISKPLSRCLG